MTLFTNVSSELIRRASLSADERHRFSLSRQWDEDLKHIVFVMLNPSTADALTDDPTIRRCMGFARKWGYGGIVVVNLFSLRATDPAQLPKDDNPTGGLHNDETIVEKCVGNRVIAAWGAEPFAKARARHVMAMLSAKGVGVECLRLTKDGHPWHPLYVRADAKPFPFRMEAQ